MYVECIREEHWLIFPLYLSLSTWGWGATAHWESYLDRMTTTEAEPERRHAVTQEL